MTSNDQLETGLIGGLEKHDIVLVVSNADWASMFLAQEKQISQALGAVALRIEHIGSTSVPGLVAKPILDILLVVENSADEGAYLPALERAGFQLRVREPEFDEHRMVRTPDRSVHIHIYSEGSMEIDRYLIFRNRLRSSADDRLRYESVKRRLAEMDWSDINEYAEAKSEVVESIIGSGRRELEAQ
jgi:GrpB-like predicted nucleotidyltransferase (UPF0157 family)